MRNSCGNSFRDPDTTLSSLAMGRSIVLIILTAALTAGGCADSWVSQSPSNIAEFDTSWRPAFPVTRTNRAAASTMLDSRKWLALDAQHAAQLTGTDVEVLTSGRGYEGEPYLVRAVYITGTEGRGDFMVFRHPDTHDVAVEYIANSGAWEQRWPLVVLLPTPPRRVLVSVSRAIPWGGKLPSAVLPHN